MTLPTSTTITTHAPTAPGSPAPAAPRARRDGDAGVTRQQRSDRTRILLERSTHAHGEELRRILDEVVVLNRGVARSVASRYLGRGISKEDLEQVACEALIKAVRRFDTSTGNDLLTYAVPTMRGELLRHFRDCGWTVRPPRRVQELQRKLTVAIEQLEQQLGREPTDREVQEALDVDDADYQEAVEAFGCFQPTSLDQPVAADSFSSMGDFLPDEPQGDAAAAVEARVALQPLVRRLPARDQRILELRFVEDLTQREIGQELGVTQMQVSRLLGRIMDRLRDQLDGTGTSSGQAAAIPAVEDQEPSELPQAG
ncbi:sigma-70 family RNA polymerase sigma factor [Nocardioides nanhaiensis]|uniref:Sigma-70 family RNA polymerase sigma factor n=1 Tax=Nocardioides nanhaiensis TaxID=1476871 RepID=A0ABP8VUC9_9ACTN